MKKIEYENLYYLIFAFGSLIFTVISSLLLQQEFYEFPYNSVCLISDAITRISILSIYIGFFGFISFASLYYIAEKFYECRKETLKDKIERLEKEITELRK